MGFFSFLLLQRVPDNKTINEILATYIDPEKSDPVIRQRCVFKIFSLSELFKMSRYLLCAYLIWEVMTLLECDVSVPFTFCSISLVFTQGFVSQRCCFWIVVTVVRTYSVLFSRLFEADNDKYINSFNPHNNPLR